MFQCPRSKSLTAVIMFALLPSAPAAAATDPSLLPVHDFASLCEVARSRAQRRYVPTPTLEGPLAQLSYDEYLQIMFRHSEGIWADGKHPFWLEMYHRGFVQRDRVSIFTLPRDRGNEAAGESVEIRYDPAMFRFGKLADRIEATSDLGFAGLRIAGRFKGTGDPQEMLTFLGSSYFRARSRDTVYGSSARALAIDIGLNRDEEFPDLVAFWVLEPAGDDSAITVLGLLDSPSVAGAYEFVFAPGVRRSDVDVRCELTYRDAPEKVAIAPLTSMWMWGDGLKGPPLDKRPSVHDSDGLLIRTSDDARDLWRWRALSRQSYPSVSSFPIGGASESMLRGFGLLQRDRQFEHFRDTGAMYHRRPSVWVTPQGDWGAGSIELLEIPGAHEGIDNIGAYFVPARRPSAGDHQTFRYRVSFLAGETDPARVTTPHSHPAIARVVHCDVHRADATDQASGDPSGASIEVEVLFQRTEFTPTFDRLQIDTVRGEVLAQTVRLDRNGILATATLRPAEAAPIELEMTLVDANGDACSETFAYLCPHREPEFVYPAVYTRRE